MGTSARRERYGPQYCRPRHLGHAERMVTAAPWLAPGYERDAVIGAMYVPTEYFVDEEEGIEGWMSEIIHIQ